MVLEDTIAQMIGNLGFPIAVTFWFMFRTEKVIKANTDALGKIGEVMNGCTKK